MTLRPPPNPILDAEKRGERPTLAVDPADLGVKLTHTKSRRDRRRELRHLFLKEAAAEAISGFSEDLDVFGLTKGQFSLIDLIDAVLDLTGGPARLTLSTWTAATADIKDVLAFLRSGKLERARFVLDFSFQRRQPAVAQAIRQEFGSEALRLTRNHAKFFQVAVSDRWSVTCKTSMNLNQNPRIEDFDLTNDPALYRFLAAVVDDLFHRTTSDRQNKASTNELQHQFYGWGAM
jgi:hypothetical protein